MKHSQHNISVTDNQNRLAWSVEEISKATGLSKNFLRYEIKRKNLPVRKFGRRVLVRNEDLIKYMEYGSEGEPDLAIDE